MSKKRWLKEEMEDLFKKYDQYHGDKSNFFSDQGITRSAIMAGFLSTDFRTN